MKLPTGTRIGAYEVVGALGAGGIGEVYRAHDPRLGRDVALKVLNDASAADGAAVVRFEREARAASALNHPNILTIYEVGTFPLAGAVQSYIAAEYIEGKTLRAALRAGTPFESLLDAFVQIAEGLAKAHDAGIVHRDLKPENVMITVDGRAKILDFGLAKLLQAGLPVTSDDATVPGGATRPGIVVGTLACMAPEQVRGEEVDVRCDVFAFGCMLYEAATGERPFAADTPEATLRKILTADPPLLDVIHRRAPGDLQRIVRRCLARERERRYANGRALLVDLRRMAESLRGGREPRATHLEQLTFAREIEQSPALAPDGNRILFCREAGGLRHLVLLDRESGIETQLSDGDYDCIAPAWTPDGGSLLYVRGDERATRVELSDVFGRDDRGSIWKLDLATGRQTLLLNEAFNPSPSPDGSRIAFDASWSGARRIWTADARGRNPQQLTGDTSEAVVHIRPRWSPDGTKIVFQDIEGTKHDVRVVDVASQAMHWITNDVVTDVHPVWSYAGDAILFSSYRGGGINIWSAPVDLDGRVAGPLEQITTGAGQDVEIDIPRSTDRIVFTTTRQNAEVWRLPLGEGGDPSGAPEPVIATTRESSRAAYSPDGSRIVYNSDRGGAMNLWLFDVARRSVSQLTRGAGGDYQASWSPDGRSVAFFSGRSGTLDIWRCDIETRHLERLTSGEGININPFFSPDGSRIAFHSDRDGRTEVWVMKADGSHPRQLTTCGAAGHFMRWTPDGGHVLFRCPTGKPRLMRVAVDGGEPEEMAEIAGGAHISLSPDGSRLIDVVNHQVLWLSTLDGSAPPRRIFEFDDGESRIDYPLWSPDGRSLLFDRFRPQGGDIWLLEFIAG